MSSRLMGLVIIADMGIAAMGIAATGIAADYT